MSNNHKNKYNAKDIIVCPHPHRHQLSDNSIIQVWKVRTKCTVDITNISEIKKNIDKIKINAFNNTKISDFLSLNNFDVSIFKINEYELEVLIRFTYGEYNEDFAYTKNVFRQIDKYFSEITHIQNRQRKDWIWFRLRTSDRS